MFSLVVICVLFGTVAVLLAGKVCLLKKSAKELAAAFADRLQTDTNTTIDIPSHDKDMCALTESINRQLTLLRHEHLRYTQGDRELKAAITNVSHDLRTPLTAICGYLDVMRQEELPPKIATYLGILTERTELMKQLTEELFRYSVILSADPHTQTEEVLVGQVLEDSIMGYYAALRERGITLRVSLPEQKIVRTVHKASLSRVFSNLLNNAVKYSDGDLEITLEEPCVITFINTAGSLGAIETERLFDRFYTVETARKSTGLGLSIAKTLVEQMGGNIRARYKENKLSVTVTL